MKTIIKSDSEPQASSKNSSAKEDVANPEEAPKKETAETRMKK